MLPAANGYLNNYVLAVLEKPASQYRNVEESLNAHVNAVLERAGIKNAGDLSLDLDENGKVKVLGDAANRDEITAALSGDMKTLSILRWLKPAPAVENSADAENASLWDSRSSIVDLSEGVHRLADTPAPYAGGNALLDKLYQQHYLREVFKEVEKRQPEHLWEVEDRGWLHRNVNDIANDQWLEKREDIFFAGMDFDSMDEREKLFDYTLKKLQNAGIDAEVVKRATLDLNYDWRSDRYEIVANAAHYAPLSDDEKQKITAALSGDKYLLDSLVSAQNKYAAQMRDIYGMHNGVSKRGIQMA
jgi:hypothetical protein